MLKQLSWLAFAALVLLESCVEARMVPVVSEYTITPSSQLAYYHYPAPQRVSAERRQQQPFAPPANAQLQYNTQRYAPRLQQQARAQQYQPQYQARAVQSQAQPQQARVQQTQTRTVQHQYQHQQQQYAAHAQPVAKQFTSPALDNVAFTMALSNQGYVFGGNTAGGASTATQARSSASADTPSLNVKLPLPFGITPLNIAPLPLQGGASYASLPRGVTSYGTLQPLRR